MSKTKENKENTTQNTVFEIGGDKKFTLYLGLCPEQHNEAEMRGIAHSHEPYKVGGDNCTGAHIALSTDSAQVLEYSVVEFDSTHRGFVADRRYSDGIKREDAMIQSVFAGERSVSGVLSAGQRVHDEQRKKTLAYDIRNICSKLDLVVSEMDDLLRQDLATLQTTLADLKEQEKLYEKDMAERRKRKDEEEAAQRKREEEESDARIEALNACAPSWTKDLENALGMKQAQELERQRFLKKFNFDVRLPALGYESDAKVRYDEDETNNEPYVRIETKLHIETSEIKVTLKFRNLPQIKNIGDSEQEHYVAATLADFSDARNKLAEWLAEKFSGKAAVVQNWNDGVAYLNVICGQDTIEVASTNLKGGDY